MKTPMIFLPGKGKLPNDPAFGPFTEIAAHFNADLIPIVAPHPHRGGFRWHNANKQPELEAQAEFEQSMLHITVETEKLLSKNGQSWNDVIWLGHSQGGGMAIHMALRHGAKRVIVFSADIPDNFPFPAHPNTSFIVDWNQAGKDNVLNPARRQSYKKLEQIGIGVNYIFCPDCMHWFLADTGNSTETFDTKLYFESIKER
ncbi:MAG: hypothetical protein FWC61_03535 [Proteobacteria bacterium]|nr:hypothetical protein [Pseudomonadota bacterium]